MAFGEVSLRRPVVPGRHVGAAAVNPDDGIVSYRQPDPGALFPDVINYSPSMIGVDFVSTDNIELQSIIAEHIAFVQSTSIDFQVSSTTGPTIQWLDAAGVAVGDLRYAPSGGGLMLESKNPSGVRIQGTPTLGSLTAYPRGELRIYGDSVAIEADTTASAYAYYSIIGGTSPDLFMYSQDGTNAVSLALHPDAGSQSLLYLPTAASYLSIGAPGASAVSYIGGNILFDNPVQTTISTGGQFTACGSRDVMAAAGQATGGGVAWRHLLTNAAGTAYVTPTSFTFNAAISTNANTVQIRSAAYWGGQFTCNSIAAGITEWFGNVVIS